MTPARLPELASLRLLIRVGSEGSLSQAARIEGISQPAASKRVALLERAFGVPLVLRSARGSELTAEGRIVCDWSRQILDTVDQLLGAVSSLKGGAGTDLHVAASMTIAEHLMPIWLSDVRSVHPELHVGLQVANSEQVQELVLEGKADIGFVEGPTIDRRLVARRVAMDRLAVVVAPAHQWASRRRPVRREELLATPLVVREQGSGTRLTLDRVLNGSHAEPLLELGSNEAVKGAVIAGAGPAVLSVLAVDAELRSGRLLELTIQGVRLDRTLSAVWPRTRQLSLPSRWLLRASGRTRSTT